MATIGSIDRIERIKREDQHDRRSQLPKPRTRSLPDGSISQILLLMRHLITLILSCSPLVFSDFRSDWWVRSTSSIAIGPDVELSIERSEASKSNTLLRSSRILRPNQGSIQLSSRLPSTIFN
ncbi:hypothetical protein SISSUDRAFT_915214 [Sistotremastrum suecicum HHB10207 ss-3]|uniref:Uncharacterized protein n=1 Tax=Sistotremastrum suecicum HHB10207 ss-3 TaxID=1314776 RepID=A0A166BZ98_9AGAM|nr:hypothetical protein SISSUDRAFT_915214 [Sistotremastrum suecicum HHB10207 ss-3]